MKKGWGAIIGILLCATGASAEPGSQVQMQTPDGHYLATAITTGAGSAIVMRDLQYEKKGGTGSLLIPVNKAPIVAITFSSDGHRMLTKESNGTERTWQISNGGAATLLTTQPAKP